MGKILVLTRNASLSSKITDILKSYGHEVDEEDNGVSALKRIEETRPNLIFCDEQLDDLDGFGLLRILRSKDEIAHISCVLMSESMDVSSFRKGMNLGADDYLTIPFEDVDLMTITDMRLRHSLVMKSTDSYSEYQALSVFEDLKKGCEIRKFKNRDVIFEEGMHPNWLYIVKEGIVSAVKTNDIGKQLITRFYVQNEMFGYLSIMMDRTYSQSLVAFGPVEVYLVSKKAFLKALYANPHFSNLILGHIALEESEANERMIFLAYSSVRKKLSACLLKLRKVLKTEDIQVSRDVLSQMMATAPETIIRTLSDFKDEGIIDIVDHNIVLKDIDGLRRMKQ